MVETKPSPARTSKATTFPVLIVEDKDSLRTMLRHALEAQDHAVVEARDEPEAIEQLRALRGSLDNGAAIDRVFGSAARWRAELLKERE